MVSSGLLKRSSELSAPSGAGGAVWEAAAFLRRSSASFAIFEEPPMSLGLGEIP